MISLPVFLIVLGILLWFFVNATVGIILLIVGIVFLLVGYPMGLYGSRGGPV